MLKPFGSGICRGRPFRRTGPGQDCWCNAARRAPGRRVYAVPQGAVEGTESGGLNEVERET